MRNCPNDGFRCLCRRKLLPTLFERTLPFHPAESFWGFGCLFYRLDTLEWWSRSCSFQAVSMVNLSFSGQSIWVIWPVYVAAICSTLQHRKKFPSVTLYLPWLDPLKKGSNVHLNLVYCQKHLWICWNWQRKVKEHFIFGCFSRFGRGSKNSKVDTLKRNHMLTVNRTRL